VAEKIIPGVDNFPIGCVLSIEEINLSGGIAEGVKPCVEPFL
jgi:hypothetical protein